MDPKILVVDDNEDNRYTLVRRLRREGYSNVVVAENGRRALDVIETDSVDLVLLDIMMPEMNGYEVLERIKARPSWRDIPVIMISAIDDIDSVVRCIELGAEDYLPKPFNPVLLKARVGSSLEKKRLRDRETLYLERLEAEKAARRRAAAAILPPSAVAVRQAQRGLSRGRTRRHRLFADIVGFTALLRADPGRASRRRAARRWSTASRTSCGARHGEDQDHRRCLSRDRLAAAAARRSGVLAAARCGLAMIAAAQSIEPRWLVRVGIHCGR